MGASEGVHTEEEGAIGGEGLPEEDGGRWRDGPCRRGAAAGELVAGEGVVAEGGAAAGDGRPAGFSVFAISGYTACFGEERGC